MAVQQYNIKVLEHSRVSPPPGSVPTTSVPLTFFDIHWLCSSPMQRLFFYEFPYPTLNFTQTTLPNLKASLSRTLQQFFPLAGHLVCPPSLQIPYILYKDGDYVPFISKESTADFGHLVGDHPRHVGEFQALLPKLEPPINTSDNCMQKPLMAIQITVFPMAGISIGVTFNHVAADGKSFIHFMKSWASANNVSQRDIGCFNKSPPDFSRDLIGDPLGIASIFMKDNWNWEDIDRPPIDKFRVTFVFNKSQIESLKNLIRKKFLEQNHQSETLRLSSFVVTCAYMWVCLVKLQQNVSHEVSSSPDILHHFIFAADCRDRLKLPSTYFGNCLEPRFASAMQSQLLGENGILVAAKAIGSEVLKLDKLGALRGAEKWLSKAHEVFKTGHAVSVAASPKLGVYETDFGWGRPRKSEVAHIGAFGAISMAESKEEEGGVEFGLALAHHELDTFCAVFKQELLI